MKNGFKAVCIVVLMLCASQSAFSQLLYPQDPKKDEYVPPYDPNVVIISDDVKKWMDEQAAQPAEKRTVEMKTDVKGRVKSSSDDIGQKELKVVDNKQKRLVVVSDMQINEVKIENMHGRAEYNQETKDFNYSLNGKKIKFEDYENLMKKHWEKFDKQKKGKRNLPVSGVVSSNDYSWTAWMTAEEISELTKNNKELAIDDYREPIQNAPIANILRATELSTYAFPNNYTGAGVGVGVVEWNCRDTSVPIYKPNNHADYCFGTTDTHNPKVVNIVQHASPDAKIFGFSAHVTPHPNPDSYSPPLQVVTHSYGYYTENLYHNIDMNMDNYIYEKRIMNFAAAGNNQDSIYNIHSPGKALNAITVGAVNPATNQYANYPGWQSSWKNSNIGNEKPEAAMYTDIDMGTYGFLDGTSASTPLLAGFTASFLEQHPFFNRQPAMMKASIISAEKIPIVNARSWDLDNFQSAQGMIKFSTTSWSTGSAWWDGENSTFFDSNNEIEHIEKNVKAGKRHKIVIAWLSEGSYISQYKRIQQDLDLRVYQNGNLLAYSRSADNPFEAVSFVAPTGDPLRVVIHRYRNGSGNGRVILGYNINYNH